MAWGIEYFVYLDAFSMSWLAALLLFLFLWIFTYFALRPLVPSPRDKALWITCCTFVAALFLAFTQIPSLWVGFILVIVYALVYRHEMKQTKHEFISSLIALWVLLTIFALLPDEWRVVLIIFSFIYFYLASEIDVRKKGKGKEKSPSKK